MLTAMLFTVAKRWKQPECSSIDEWINKIRFIHTTKHFSAIKGGNSDTCYIMDYKDIIPSDTSQSQKDKHYMILLT